MKHSAKMAWPIIALLVCMIVITVIRIGVRPQSTGQDVDLDLEFSEPVNQEAECLVIVNSDETYHEETYANMAYVLESMRIKADVWDVSSDEAVEDYDGYETIVLAINDWSPLNDYIRGVFSFVKNGGRLMNTITPEPNATFARVKQKLGVIEGGDIFSGGSTLKIRDDFMIGAEDTDTFKLSTGDEVVNTSLQLILDNNADVKVAFEENGVPVIWENNYGDGKLVFINIALNTKFQRGFLCASYSLLEDVCIYPVINGSAYYLDDFPAPVPAGNSIYITRDYDMSIERFITDVWWPDVCALEHNYGVKHTGVIIEDYNDNTVFPFAENNSITRFKYFGGSLLNQNGEIGLHGYNHMPLCEEGFDYRGGYDGYNLWPDENSMYEATAELNRLAKTLFPDETMRVYVPPSNILSDEGKNMLIKYFPDLRIIASVYLPELNGVQYVQEFDVEDSGLINTPRITSGEIFDENNMITALGEMNFHFVQSHFMHPDDVLDVDRGAELGWEELYSRLDSYTAWISSSAPDMRNLTGSELGEAVLQYDKLTVNREQVGDTTTAKLGGFSDEAYFLMRVNKGELESVSGGDYTEVLEGLYLVRALEDELTIKRSLR